jgi:hypothetical protein
MPSLVHHAGIATLVNLCFVVAALACSFGLPRWLSGTGAGAGVADDDTSAAGNDTEEDEARRGSAASVRNH